MYLIRWTEAILYVGYVDHMRLLPYDYKRLIKFLEELNQDSDVIEIEIYDAQLMREYHK